MSHNIDIESKINSSIYNPNFSDIKQFKLILETKDKKTYRFLKNTVEKYCQIINVFDKIDFNKISNFELIINDKLINKELINIKHFLNKDNMDTDDCYIYKDRYIYIEFLNDNNYTNCCCYIKNLSSQIFNTPPNY